MNTVDTTASSTAEGLLVALFGILAIIIVVAVVVAILSIIAWWKIFTKAGIKGWKSIIPFYSGYLQYKLSWKPLWYWISLVVGVAVSSLSPHYTTDSSGATVQTSGASGAFATTILVIVSIASFVIGVMLLWKLAKSFGRGTGFFLGLVFLNFIFMLILAFGDSKYIGPGGVAADAPQIETPDGPDKLEGVIADAPQIEETPTPDDSDKLEGV